MAHRYLGEPFDIHGGGADLIFPHHENEIAQSEGAFGDGQFARHWLHSGMVNFGGEKMSKSLGNVVTIRKVAETHDLEALRLHLIGVHYRSPVAFTIAPRRASGRARLSGAGRGRGAAGVLLPDAGPPGGGARRATTAARWSPPADKTLAVFNEAMDDDFNTAAAVGHLYEAFVLANKLLDDAKAAPKDVRRRTLARLRRDLAACGETLGIFQREPAAFLDALPARACAPGAGSIAAAVEARIAERAAARAAKDFARGRRDPQGTLQASGVELMDTPAGTTWRVAEAPGSAAGSVGPTTGGPGRVVAAGVGAGTRPAGLAVAAVVHALAQLLADLEEGQPLRADAGRPRPCAGYAPGIPCTRGSRSCRSRGSRSPRRGRARRPSNRTSGRSAARPGRAAAWPARR